MFGDKMIVAGISLFLNGKPIQANTDIFDLVVDGEGGAALDVTLTFDMSDDVRYFLNNRESLELGVYMLNESMAFNNKKE